LIVPDAASNANGNRLTWKDIAGILQEINKRLEEQSKERAAMETRLLRELACKNDVDTLRTDVEILKRNSYTWNGINSVITAAIGAFAAWLSGRQ
jgi:hypothetical protein